MNLFYQSYLLSQANLNVLPLSEHLPKVLYSLEWAYSLFSLESVTFVNFFLFMMLYDFFLQAMGFGWINEAISIINLYQLYLF